MMFSFFRIDLADAIFLLISFSRCCSSKRCIAVRRLILTVCARCGLQYRLCLQPRAARPIPLLLFEFLPCFQLLQFAK